MKSHRLVREAIFACRLLAIGVILLFVVGCRESRTTVSGTVTLDGRPLSIASDARGTVVFHPVGGQGIMLTSLLDSSGNFRLATGASSDVAPGKYQVAVSIVELLPKVEGTEQTAKRITPAKYALASDSGLQAHVVPGENRVSLNIDSSADEEDSEVSDATSSSDAPDNPEPQPNSAKNQ